jgi:beta-lactam-binding protein with PASTA domain
LLHYGLFLAVCFFVGLVTLLLFRPFWLWFTGQSEALERLRKLTEVQAKVLFELEMLNKTLSIPLKKSAGPKQEAPKETPVDTGEFLKALEKTRGRLRDNE